MPVTTAGNDQLPEPPDTVIDQPSSMWLKLMSLESFNSTLTVAS
jgi:hypothetical protein